MNILNCMDHSQFSAIRWIDYEKIERIADNRREKPTSFRLTIHTNWYNKAGICTLAILKGHEDGSGCEWENDGES
jgi:hypothetical protein